MAWVYSLPLWLAVVVFIGGSSLISAAGLLVVRRLYRPEDEITHNDVAGPVMTTIGTVLAVLLTFMVVTVWQEYDAAAQVASTEAAELTDLYHESGALGESAGASIRRLIEEYGKTVVRYEWPIMRWGGESADARAEALRVVLAVAHLQPHTMAEQNAQADALSHAHAFIDARRTRIFNNEESVPALVWSMMIFVAATTICSSYFFRVASRNAHLLMTVALGAVVGATFVMIAELDLPFRGEIQVPPTAFVTMLGAMQSENATNSGY